MRPIPYRRAALAATLGALVLPAAANAAVTVERSAAGSVYLSGEVTSPTTILIVNASGKTRVTNAVAGSGCLPVAGGADCGDAKPLGVRAELTGQAKVTLLYGGGSLGNAPAALETGDGPDVISVSGAPQTTIDGGLGDDALHGGEGEDLFLQGAEPDGADAIDGGDDHLAGDARTLHGDVVSYFYRDDAVKVSLPADVANQPMGSNGEAGEGDKLAHLEGARTGSGSDALSGNERPNYLTAGHGADTVSAGNGDDYVDVRRTIFGSDPDSSIACGGGDADVLKGDLEDPAALGCEGEAPGIVGGRNGVTIKGTPEVGQALTLAYKTFGAPPVTAVRWYDCPDPDATCTLVPDATGTTFTPEANRAGHFLYASLELRAEAAGPVEDEASSETIGPVAVAAGTAHDAPEQPGIPDGPASSPHAPSGTVPALAQPGSPDPVDPFPAAAARLARSALGRTAVAARGLSGDRALVFEPSAAAAGTIRLDTRGRAKLAGVVCRVACTVTARSRVEPIVGRRSGGDLRLPSSRLELAPGRLGVVRVSLDKRQRAAVRHASKSTLRLRLVVAPRGSSGARPATRTYRLRAARQRRSGRFRASAVARRHG